MLSALYVGFPLRHRAELRSAPSCGIELGPLSQSCSLFFEQSAYVNTVALSPPLLSVVAVFKAQQ